MRARFLAWIIPSLVGYAAAAGGEEPSAPPAVAPESAQAPADSANDQRMPARRVDPRMLERARQPRFLSGAGALDSKEQAEGLRARRGAASELLKQRSERRELIKTRKAEAHRRKLLQRFGHGGPPASELREELRLHAERVARLKRIIRLARANKQPELASRARNVLDRERSRHEKRVSSLAPGAVAPGAVAPAPAAGGAPAKE